MLIQVILPIPLQGTFTYSVPDDVRDMVGMGTRVLVQFGRKKYYTAIVAGIDQTPPGNYEVKEIMAVLDPHPALRYPQLKFWEWLADYYLCSVGEVMKAALPTGLKSRARVWSRSIRSLIPTTVSASLIVSQR